MCIIATTVAMAVIGVVMTSSSEPISNGRKLGSMASIPLATAMENFAPGSFAQVPHRRRLQTTTLVTIEKTVCLSLLRMMQVPRNGAARSGTVLGRGRQAGGVRRSGFKSGL